MKPAMSSSISIRSTTGSKGNPMTYTYCMTSICTLATQCARYEDDAGKHLLTRTYADFSEELIRQPDGKSQCPFFIEKSSQQSK